MSNPSVLSLGSLFEIAAREYEVISFDAAARSTARLVIIGLCIGIFLAALYSVYQRTVPGGIVRALLKAEALSPEAAKSLAELGLGRNPLCSFEIKRNAMLGRFLRAVDGEEGEEPRYYIPEEQKYAADVRFERGGNPVVTLVLSAVGSLALAVILCKGLPVVLGIVDGFLK